MPLVYRFSFDAKYAGQPVHILNSSSQEVAGSPFTLDADGDYALTTTADHYRARVATEVFGGDGYTETDGELDIPASIAAAGGGGGVSESAAWFTITATENFDNVSGSATFTVVDDGRAPARADLVAVDGGDSTTLNVVASGEYLISLTVGAEKLGGTVETPGLAALQANIAINGDNEAPAYYTPVGNLMFVKTGGSQTYLPCNLVIHQTLQAGDTIQVPLFVNTMDALAGTGLTWTAAGAAIGFTKIG